MAPPDHGETAASTYRPQRPPNSAAPDELPSAGVKKRRELPSAAPSSRTCSCKSPRTQTPQGQANKAMAAKLQAERELRGTTTFRRGLLERRRRPRPVVGN